MASAFAPGLALTRYCTPNPIVERIGFTNPFNAV
jgi:hypothetical protein